jgi:parvulin-like peptidyl-prolyl isomerase
MSVAHRALREPLLHFLLIGAALFLLYGALNRGGSEAPREIVISEARIEALAENFATVWMRPPTAVELKGLIDDYVAEEVYYREALAMGLDQDDTVIRRRLRQKMEFISENIANSVEPTDAQLQEFLAQNAGKFARPAELSFRQVYLSAERRGDTARDDAEKLLAELQAGRGPADPAEAGDATLLLAAMEAASPQAIANAFGEEFARQVDEAPVGQWSGPIESAFGVHLVRVDERVITEAPTLGEIRPIVLREWQAEHRGRQNESFLAALREKYEVRVEGPAAELFSADVSGGAAR